MIVKMSFEPIQTLEEKVCKLTRDDKKLQKRHERAIKANQKA